ncbi:hypothetical protein Tcan_16959 [Toxocara canis]|uniref:Male-enhanced antigen 1 n=1 Tax=Toxocara canis TaxID=6265 RepID=A0A0B2VFL4_TOXCA|nr:hypothetical protein Tcan_16959 [Toxocara canis]
MNGVGVANYGNASSEDESSAESDAVSELGADSRYIGYEAIPNGPDSAVHESECWTTFNIPPSIQRQFEQAFSDSSNVHMKDSDFAIEHHPQPIDLDEEKVAYIKSAMSSFTLPAPSWAAGMQTDEELRRIFERISSKK